MSNASDFIIENGVLTKYVGPGGDVVIPESVTSINSFVFSEYHKIMSVTIPKSVTHIDYPAFDDCNTLTDLVIYGKEITIDGSFYSCNNLQQVIAPELPWHVIQKLGLQRQAARSYLQNSEKYTDPQIVEAYHKYLRMQKKKMLPEIFNADLVQGLAIYAQIGIITPQNVDEVFLQAAYAAKALQCVAFLLDWKATNITPQQQQKLMEQKLLEDPYGSKQMKQKWVWEKLQDNTLAITDYKGNDTIVQIPDRIGMQCVSSIGGAAFSTTKPRRLKAMANHLRTISSITLPENITEIGEEAFSGCENLVNFVIPENIRRIGSRAFSGCKNLTGITTPATVEKIEDWTFTNCQKLHNIIFRGSITDIGKGAFSDCTSITSITIPDGTTSLGGWAFYRCHQLAHISLPGSLVYIGPLAFCECSRLTIHAPAGSYVETYAKENNIPFVAE